MVNGLSVVFRRWEHLEAHADFWNKNAKRYDRFMRKDAAAYRQMYELIRPVVKSKTVLAACYAASERNLPEVGEGNQH